MTDAQAIEIRQHLVNELISHGFGDIVLEVNTRLEESDEERLSGRSPRSMLDFLLRESIEVFENLSNGNYEELIRRFNQLGSFSDARIESIVVELLTTGEPEFYNLRELPDYESIIGELREILTEIEREH